jgi:XTP/dITP diphosphohydrolase
MKLLLASSNAGKLAELRELLGAGFQLHAQSEFGVGDAEETGLSFIENAILKARHAALASGLPALADDSGIEVDALDGAPGTLSARFAGPGASDADNVRKLLDLLRQVPEALRTARFHCAIVLMRHGRDPMPWVCQGTWEGAILTAPRGPGGFGYDPVFRAPETGGSAAELPAEVKNRLSHRARALRQLQAQLAGGEA